jgi:hypothetical protein
VVHLRALAVALLQHAAELRVLPQLGVGVHDLARLGAGAAQELEVLRQVREAQVQYPRRPGAEEIS